MKKYFVAGIVVLLPLALTFWIVSFVIDVLTTPFMGVARALISAICSDEVSRNLLAHERLLTLMSTILVLVFLLIMIVAIGAIGRYFFFKYLIRFSDRILGKIPFINSVYKTSQELIQAVLTTSNNSFKQVVLVPSSSHDSLSIGFITRNEIDADKHTAVFVPTTPNPTSGFLMLFKPEAIIPIDMTVEEAFRFIISCGVLPMPIRKVSDVPTKMP